MAEPLDAIRRGNPMSRYAIVNKPGHPAHGLRVRIVSLALEPSYNVRWNEKPNGHTGCALAESELVPEDQSESCTWWRLTNDPNPLELMRVRYLSSCCRRQAVGPTANYPDNCPSCGKPVVIGGSFPLGAKE